MPAINGSRISALLTKLYAIGSGGTSKLKVSGDKAYALTASGKIALSELSGTNTTGSTGANKGSTGSYVVSGTGSGHNVGLCQWGAKAMADAGYDYEEILHYYFTDIEIDYLY